MVQLVVGGVAVLLVMALLLIDSKRAGSSEGNVARLAWGRTYKAVGVFGILMPPFAVATETVAGRYEQAVVLGLIFAVLGLPIFLSAFFWHVDYDGEAMYAFSPWRATRKIPFDQVRSYRFSGRMKQWVVDAGTHGTIRVNTLVPGAADFVAYMQRRGIQREESA